MTFAESYFPLRYVRSRRNYVQATPPLVRPRHDCCIVSTHEIRNLHDDVARLLNQVRHEGVIFKASW